MTDSGNSVGLPYASVFLPLFIIVCTTAFYFTSNHKTVLLNDQLQRAQKAANEQLLREQAIKFLLEEEEKLSKKRSIKAAKKKPCTKLKIQDESPDQELKDDIETFYTPSGDANDDNISDLLLLKSLTTSKIVLQLDPLISPIVVRKNKPNSTISPANPQENITVQNYQAPAFSSPKSASSRLTFSNNSLTSAVSRPQRQIVIPDEGKLKDARIMFLENQLREAAKNFTSPSSMHASSNTDKTSIVAHYEQIRTSLLNERDKLCSELLAVKDANRIMTQSLFLSQQALRDASNKYLQLECELNGERSRNITVNNLENLIGSLNRDKVHLMSQVSQLLSENARYRQMIRDYKDYTVTVRNAHLAEVTSLQVQKEIAASEFFGNTFIEAESTCSTLEEQVATLVSENEAFSVEKTIVERVQIQEVFDIRSEKEAIRQELLSMSDFSQFSLQFERLTTQPQQVKDAKARQVIDHERLIPGFKNKILEIEKKKKAAEQWSKTFEDLPKQKSEISPPSSLKDITEIISSIKKSLQALGSEEAKKIQNPLTDKGTIEELKELKQLFEDYTQDCGMIQASTDYKQ